MAKEYKKLNKFEDYDHESAEQLAEALNELREVASRAVVLKDLIQENTELHPFVWTTAEGKSIALHDIEADHFVNILNHIVGSGRSVNKALRAEAMRRSVPLPGERLHLGVGADYEEDVDFVDIPF